MRHFSTNFFRNVQTCKYLLAQIERKEYDAAIVAAKQFVSKNTTTTNDEQVTEEELRQQRVNKSMGQYLIALAQWKKKSKLEAKDAVEAALAVDSQNPFVLLQKAVLFPSNQILTQAQLAWQALKKAPYSDYKQLSEFQFADAYVMQANYLKKTGDYISAIDYYQRAMATGMEQDAQVYMDRAWCHFQEEEFAMAEHYMDKAVEKSNNDHSMVIQRLLLRSQSDACDMNLLFADYEICKQGLPQEKLSSLYQIMNVALENQLIALRSMIANENANVKETIQQKLQPFQAIPFQAIQDKLATIYNALK